MSSDSDDQPTDATDVEMEVVLSHLNELEDVVDSPHERRKVVRIRRLLEQVPGGRAVEKQIERYTRRDIAEGFVGGIIFSLPLLVEDGVFEIAEWFAATTIGPIPLFMAANVTFIVIITVGLLYFTDIREVKIHKPILGFIPRRVVGILLISFIVAAGMMFLWGRLHEGNPTRMEALGRIAVIWTAAVFGTTLGDILPGERADRDGPEFDSTGGQSG